MRVPLYAATLLGLLALSSGALTATRGLIVQLRESEAAGAPLAEQIKLYGASHALVIGIDNYTNGWPRLSKAVEDARAVATALQAKGFEVTLRTNLAADELRKTFREFFAIKGAEPSSRLFLWFAGHGHTVNGEGFLVPADAPPAIAPAFKLSALPMRDFGSLVRLAEAKHVLSVFDSCFSGTIFQARSSSAPKAITRKTTAAVRQFITSGDAGQEVRDDGSFREYFVRALNGEERSDFNKDGYVTGEELGLFLNQRMTDLTSAAQTPKAGKLHDVRYNLGDFVFRVALGPPERAEAPPVPRRGRVLSGGSAEMLFWESIKDSKNRSKFQAYLDQYPQGSFARLARLELEELKPKKPAAVPAPVKPAITLEPIEGTYVALRNANVRAALSTAE
jgi:hypothetical protein